MQPETALQLATSQLTRVRQEIGKIIVGQAEVVDGVLICLLAGGHVLLEGVPASEIPPSSEPSRPYCI